VGRIILSRKDSLGRGRIVRGSGGGEFCATEAALGAEPGRIEARRFVGRGVAGSIVGRRSGSRKEALVRTGSASATGVGVVFAGFDGLGPRTISAMGVIFATRVLRRVLCGLTASSHPGIGDAPPRNV
jgi:hypothetical protein